MKANLPRSFLTLPKKEKEIINKVMSEEVDRIVNAEEAEMQKIWIQMACIILHNNFNFTKDDCMMFVGGWKSTYRKNVRLRFFGGGLFLLTSRVPHNRRGSNNSLSYR